MNSDVPEQLIAEKISDKNQTNTRAASQSIGWSDNASDWDQPPRKNKHAQPAENLVLQANDLTLLYGQNPILTNVSFNLYQGDTLGLLGLNGAGKSTLLRILAGALAPQQGEILIGEDELYQNPLGARMNIGYAPDKPATYPEFRVVEFLKFIATMRRIPKSEAGAAIDNVIERCALGDVRRRVIGNLSTGYQQRVNLAQALIHSPNVLILDEPATGLDPVQLIEMRELVSTLSADQATIFSSHSLHEVSSVCNRVLLIHSGQAILDASLDQLSNEHNVTFDITLADSGDTDLSNLPGVDAACRIHSTRWMVTGDPMLEQHLKTMLNVRGQSILTMTKVDNYLETLFKQLDAHHDTASTDQNKKNTDNGVGQ